MNNKVLNIISNELASNNDDVIKLRNLNRNPILNNYLSNKQYNDIIKTVIHVIENRTEATNNINVLKFYLHEIGLIFNLNISQKYLQGVV